MADDQGGDERVHAIDATPALDVNREEVVNDVFRNMLADDAMEDVISKMLHDAEPGIVCPRQLEKLRNMRKDANTPLYPSCEVSKLEADLMLLSLKFAHGLSDKCFGDVLCVLKKLLPCPNELPEMTYEAKQMICPLGLEVEKFHACRNDCILYRGKEYKDLDKCPKCEAPWYKDIKNDSRTKGGPVKVAWYFPVHPRLERLFANAETAKLLRWHEEGRRKDKMLRHPAVGSDWRSIDFMFKKNFGYGARNIMFGLSTDGMNPFDMVRTNHSSWPMMICIYNLPPWLCMKRAYLQLAVMIQGPKQPGNDIDVYLEPLMDYLQKLWNDGLTVWDEYTKKHCLVKGMLLNTITDLPGRGCLSGEATKGYHGCVECLDETVTKWLPNSNKMVYMGHRRGLLRHHPYRRDKKPFDGTVEHRQLPKYRDGKQIFKEVSKLNVVLGKGKGKVAAPAGSLWKKGQSCGDFLIGNT